MKKHTAPALVAPFSCVPLVRALSRAERRRIRSHMHSLLAWQRTLDGWPRAIRAPDATPFVTIYAGGTLRGCFGSNEGPPGERLTRAFLRALEDARYGQVRTEERERLAVVVSYTGAPRPVDPALVDERVEAGVEGLGVVEDGRAPVIILPHVARDLRLGPGALLAQLLRKAGRADVGGSSLFAFPSQSVVVRVGDQEPPRVDAAGRASAAAAWLGRLVSPSGAVDFAVDPRTGRRWATGPMRHGRAAVALRALDEHGDHATEVRRARAWLNDEIVRGLRGEEVEGWPAEPDKVAGTLALAHLSDIDLAPELLAAARGDVLRSSPWHAAQVVTALGRKAPEPLWRACLDDLAGRPWAPWTVLAARSRGQLSAVEGAVRAVVGSIRRAPPHEGGCGATKIPETALTALVVEALAGVDDREAREALRLARGFLRRRQLVGEDIPASFDPLLADGAFAASPLVADVLRCDIVGHALLALGGRGTARGESNR
jgi:AMMECR1 domain-containing protein